MGKILVDPNRLCMGCMAVIADSRQRCPHCGFCLASYEQPYGTLSPYEILHGKYLIGRVIGMGGFGITYVGWDFYQSRKVCIKEYFPRSIAVRLPGKTTGSQPIQPASSVQYSLSAFTQNTEQAQYAYAEGLKTYIKEAENLSHFYLMDGIVSVRDFFYENNTAYIVMEYIDGIDMKHYAEAKGGRISPEELFSILRDVLIALHKVHQVNIIHRDISPDNIMLTRDYKAKLIDFGAARDYSRYKNGPVLLKRGYAPPEQYERDGEQGPWTDVYSLCASIYYLLTGRKIQDALERRERDQLKLLQVLGVPVSEEQDFAIRKGLSLRSEDRYQTVAQLFQVLYGKAL